MASAQLADGLVLTVVTVLVLILLIFSRLHKRRKAIPNPQTVKTLPSLGVDQDQGSQTKKMQPGLGLDQEPEDVKTRPSLGVDQVALAGVRFEAQSSPSRNPPDYQESEPPSSYSAASGHEYEVFLNFMGKDTRRGFTDHLYHRMIDAGICVFKDNVNLPAGEGIAFSLSQAIKKSKIAMPILSTNYASSRWCLDELVCILESRKTRKQRVLPIFYDVTPSQVRHQTGSYAKAFKEHVNNYGKEIAENWKAALVDVSLLKGLELEETGGFEGELTKLIVKKVLSELKKVHLVVTDSLVGINRHAKAVTELLQMSKKDVKIVGIWGMGGIGKTTLAKFIYNQILDEFECCSFLKDIRETSLHQKGLESLQTQLVFDLSKEARPIFTSTDEGVNELKHRFREKKVLILLDDVDDIHQLHAFVVEINWFGPGSRIIVTTRARDVLDVYQESEVYEVDEMDQESAHLLFCKHAFRQDGPVAGLELLSHAIVETTGGLPLALEVIGSFLSRKRKSIWEETLKELRQMPKKEVQVMLEVSYEKLDDDQKQMFLDVACLLIGEDIDAVIHVWKDRNFSAEIGKDVLLAMSLIKIGEDNKIWMHDQLRDLGREIVRQENYKEPGKRSRLWQEDEARDALVSYVGHGSSGVEALHLNSGIHSYFWRGPSIGDVRKEFESLLFPSYKLERYWISKNSCITNKHLRTFSNIWLLKLRRVDLIGDFEHLLPKLRWLTWEVLSCNSTPTNLSLKNLLVLDLSFSEIGNDSKLWSSFESAKKLKVLNLSYCMGLYILDTSMFINLERLILDNCLQLKEISIGMLENLNFLSTKNCSSLKELPESIGKLKSLRELDLSGTTFPLPCCVDDLEELEILKIDQRGTILEFGKLRIIDVFTWEGLKGNNLTERWTISVRIYLKLIKNLNGSEVLHELKFSGDWDYQQRNSQQLLGRFKGVEMLELLNVVCCGSIEILPIPSNLRFVVRLDLDNCEKLQIVEGLDELGALRELNIRYCGELNRLPSLSKLKSLRIMSFSYCRKLQELEGLDELERLEELNVRVCGELEKLPDLFKLKSLRILNCSWCEKLKKLEGLDGLEVLEKLDVRWCTTIKKLSGLSELKLMTRLYCCGCEMLQDVGRIDRLEALEFLSISGCKAMAHIPNLPQQMKAKLCWLNLSGCESYKRIHRDPRLRSFCSICKLGSEDLHGILITGAEEDLS